MDCHLLRQSARGAQEVQVDCEGPLQLAAGRPAAARALRQAETDKRRLRPLGGLFLRRSSEAETRRSSLGK
eukprot:3339996-Alexandrium_andersonii.AAC.1